MDRHVHQQRVVDRVVAMAVARRAVGVAPEVDADRADRPQRALAYQPGHHARRRKEAVVLAQHQHAVVFFGRRDDLVGLGQRRRERLFEQHVPAGGQRRQRHGDMRRQRGGDQHRVGVGLFERGLERVEAASRWQVEPPTARAIVHQAATIVFQAHNLS